jgi:hypothetical protein
LLENRSSHCQQVLRLPISLVFQISMLQRFPASVNLIKSAPKSFKNLQFPPKFSQELHFYFKCSPEQLDIYGVILNKGKQGKTNVNFFILNLV